jgi:uncharacterized protein YggE
MILKLLAAGAALTIPAAASAQVAAARGPASVEVVATGSIDAPASWFSVTLTYSVQDEDKAAAEKAHLAKQQAIRVAAQKVGLPLSAITMTPGSESVTTTTPEVFDTDSVMTDVSVVDDTSDKKKGKAKEEEAAPAVVEEPKPMIVISDTATVHATTLDQARGFTEALEAIDVQASKPVAVLADPEGTRRQAKAKALAVARDDAAAYGQAMGLRPVRISRISETGGQSMLPGIQEKFLQAIYAGPQALQTLFQNTNPAVVHVEETIVVEFVMAP